MHYALVAEDKDMLEFLFDKGISLKIIDNVIIPYPFIATMFLNLILSDRE